MANFLRNNGLYLLILICIIGLFMMMLVNVHAEEYEDIGSAADSDASFTEGVLSDLSEIKQSLKILEENTSDMADSNKDLNVNLSENLDRLESEENNGLNGNESIDSEFNHSGSIYSDADQSGSEPDGSGQEVSATDDETENSGASTNADYDPEQVDRIITGLDVLHSDLFKIMISIWAMAGLVLGTKLVSRLFGV